MNIDIENYIKEDCVFLEIKGKSKKSIISGVIDQLIEKGHISKDRKKDILKAFLQREEMGSTAIGGGVALPHVRTEYTDAIILCLLISSEGVDFNALDQEPVHVIALLISPQKEAGTHLKMLALLARILKDKYFIQRLKEAATVKQVVQDFSRQQSLIK